MNLRICILDLEPVQPLRFSLEGLRSYLSRSLAGYSSLHRLDAAGFIHRYPVIQCKEVRGNLMAIGISQGADCLLDLTRDHCMLGDAENACRITGSDPVIRNEPFGIADFPVTCEFLTPWLALNQQHAKMFYDLKGKPERDDFMQTLLTSQLRTLCKSLDYAPVSPVTCEAKVRFRRDRIGRENVMVFLGRFRTNLAIPDYLGIGWSVSQGYGTIKRITESPERIAGEP